MGLIFFSKSQKLTTVDRKGGTLVVRNGKLDLLEGKCLPNRETNSWTSYDSPFSTLTMYGLT